jgi:hypothetical protein
MIQLEYNQNKFEIKYRIKDADVTMTPNEMIAHINNNGEINDRVGFIVPFSVYYGAIEQARRIDEAIESRRARRRF